MNKLDIVSTLTYTITKLIPKKKNRWVFGSWFGTAISDNTKALSDYIEINNPEIEMIWVTNNPENIKLTHGKAVKRNSLKSLFYIVTARVAIMNQGYGDLNACNFLGGCFKVQLWHGVAWKKIVKDAMDKPSTLSERIMNKIFDYINKYDLFISPSKKQSEVMRTAFNIDESKILLCGQPRNSVLFSDSYRMQARKKILKKIGKNECKLLVYMPTFRDKKADVFSFGDEQNFSKLYSLQKKFNFVIIEKSHYAAQKKMKNKYNSRDNLYFMPEEKAEVLLAAADMLITDYSSCFFDFLITDRPIINFVYDYEYYVKDDRGVYYDKDSVTCGECPETTDQLWHAIEENLEWPEKNSKIREKRREEYITYEKPNNCEVIYAEILRKI